MNSTPRFHKDAETIPARRGARTWHDKAIWYLRTKRDLAADDVPDWEALRTHAAALKAHVLDHLPDLLAQFIERARAAGWHIHCAADAEELRTTVHGIPSGAGPRRS